VAHGKSNLLDPRVGGEIAPDMESVPVLHQERSMQWKRIDGASFLTLEEKRRAAGFV
jgi:hypothetical protein